jgi:hypothetical protein
MTDEQDARGFQPASVADRPGDGPEFFRFGLVMRP